MKTRQQWADEINTEWRGSVAGIIALGQRLIDAKAELHGTFEDMVRHDLVFGERTAERLMAIARDPRLKATHASLPCSWMTLYETTRLTDKQFKLAIDTGIIRADMRRRDLAPFLRPDKPGPGIRYRSAEERQQQEEKESRAKEKATRAIMNHGEAAQTWAALFQEHGKAAAAAHFEAVKKHGLDSGVALLADIGDDALATQYVIDAKESGVKRAVRHLGQRPAQVALTELDKSASP
jgi:hypothetical protein